MRLVETQPLCRNRRPPASRTTPGKDCRVHAGLRRNGYCRSNGIPLGSRRHRLPWRSVNSSSHVKSRMWYSISGHSSILIKSRIDFSPVITLDSKQSSRRLGGTRLDPPTYLTFRLTSKTGTPAKLSTEQIKALCKLPSLEGCGAQRGAQRGYADRRIAMAETEKSWS